MDQIEFCEDMVKDGFYGMTDIQKKALLKKYEGRKVDIWGYVKEASSSSISLRIWLAINDNGDQAVGDFEISYSPKFESEVFQLRMNQLVCINTTISNTAYPAYGSYTFSYMFAFAYDFFRCDSIDLKRGEELLHFNEKKKSIIKTKIQKQLQEWKTEEENKERIRIEKFTKKHNDEQRAIRNEDIVDYIVRVVVIQCIWAVIAAVFGWNVWHSLNWITVVLSLVIGFLSWLLAADRRDRERNRRS